MQREVDVWAWVVLALVSAGTSATAAAVTAMLEVYFQ